ncbi:MAG: hypothetical protein HS122_05770 [Opitutaceae bacterium]|nr:hypothetical protein [Opitutaceae bacterium]
MNLSSRGAVALVLILCLRGINLFAGPMQGPAIKYSIYDRDPDTGNGPIKFLSAGEKYASDFNLLEKGFDPLTMKITAARVTFAFADDNGDQGKEYASVWLGASLWMNNTEVDGNHNNAPANYDYYYEEWNISNSADLAFLTSLNSGILYYSVESTNPSGRTAGDFYLKIAQLEINTECIVKAAEGGSTALLMFASILGMGWLQKRLRRGTIPI